MAFDVMQSLFGLTPSSVQQTMKAEEEARALGQARMLQGNPFAAGVFPAIQAGERLLTGTRELAGVVDPRMKAATDLRTTIQGLQDQGIDMATPEGMIQLASELNKNPDFAGMSVALRQQAAKMQGEMEKTQAEIGLKKAQTEKALREPAEGKVLPPGSVMVDAQGNIIARGEPVTPKNEQPSESKKKYDELVALGVPPERARAIAYKTESTDIRRALADQKEIDKAEAKTRSEQLATSNAQRVITTIGEARNLVSGWTAGLGGSLAFLPSSEARTLQNKIQTIKANLGFDRLQQMRDASPTGGALGQVAVQEINYLQSTVATLDQLDNPEALRAALTRIEESYKRWLDAIQGRPVAPVANEPVPAQAKPKQQKAPTTQAAPGEWRIVE
jgi:hypothetical protein